MQFVLILGVGTLKRHSGKLSEHCHLDHLIVTAQHNAVKIFLKHKEAVPSDGVAVVPISCWFLVKLKVLPVSFTNIPLTKHHFDKQVCTTPKCDAKIPVYKIMVIFQWL